MNIFFIRVSSFAIREVDEIAQQMSEHRRINKQELTATDVRIARFRREQREQEEHAKAISQVCEGW